MLYDMPWTDSPRMKVEKNDAVYVTRWRRYVSFPYCVYYLLILMLLFKCLLPYHCRDKGLVAYYAAGKDLRTVFFIGSATLKCLIQSGVYFFMHVLSGISESLTLSVTEDGIYNAEK